MGGFQMTKIQTIRERIDWPQVSTAVFNLRPGCTWLLEGEELYENLKWDDTNPVGPPTKEEVEIEIERIRQDSAMKYLRLERDRRLIDTDWWAVGDRVMSQEEKDYRQSLRDITKIVQPVFDPTSPTRISNVDWPVKP